MSFLLDALGKADDDRRRAHIPELRTRREPSSSAWRYVFLGVIATTLLVFSFAAGYMLRPSIEARIAGKTNYTVTPPNPVALATGDEIRKVARPGDSATHPLQDTNSPLELEVISWSEQPEARFAMLNGVVVREGDLLGTGERLLGIEQNAVVLEKDGNSFRISM